MCSTRASSTASSALSAPRDSEASTRESVPTCPPISTYSILKYILLTLLSSALTFGGRAVRRSSNEPLRLLPIALARSPQCPVLNLHQNMNFIHSYVYCRWYIKMPSGAAAGVLAHSLLYPGDTVRRRMQTNGIGGNPKIYRNTLDAIRKVF